MSSYRTRQLFALSSWFDNHKEIIPAETSVSIVSTGELERVSSLKTANQVLAVAEIPLLKGASVNFKNLILMLDDISDPGNLGTIIRTADWFGITRIICSEGCVDVYNPKVIQATMGSVFRMEISYCNLDEVLKNVPDATPVYGALLKGSNVFTAKLVNEGIIIIGNESKGISSSLVPFITKKISIPSFAVSKSNSAESLNAAIATAIVLAEFRKRK
ncbi:MAG: RNA methyltransferase [Bacteroidales bacterium]